MYALYFVVACGLWLMFKYVEPYVYPPVKDFEITHAEPLDNSVIIYGRFTKTARNCDPPEVFGYSGGVYVRVDFPRRKPDIRLPREQSFGPWVLTPSTPTIELYSVHQCSTGKVTTLLFSGVLVL